MQNLKNIDAEINYLLNELSEGIILIDNKKNIHFINEAAKLILGNTHTKNKKLDLKISEQKSTFCTTDNSIYDIQAIPFDDATGWRITIKARKDPNDNMLGDAAFLFSNIFTHPDNSVYLYNCKKERFEFISPMLSDIFDLNNDAFFNINIKEYSELVYISESNSYVKNINMAIAKNETDCQYLNLNYLVRNHNKSFWLNDYITISFAENNKPLFIVGIVSNISSQKIIDKKLIENEKRLQAHLMLSGDAVFEHNLISNRFTYGFNWVQLLGFWPSDIEKLYESWLELIHIDDLDGFKSNYDNFIKSKEDRFKQLCRIKTHTNKYKQFLVNALVTDWDETESPSQVIGTVKDVSKTELLGNTASEISNVFDLVVKNSPNGVVIVDRNGKICGWNNGMELISGIEKSAALARNIWDIQAQLTTVKDIDQIWVEQLAVSFKELIRNNPNGIDIVPEITKLQHTDGTIKDIFVRTGTIHDESNYWIVQYFTDMSDLPQLAGSGLTIEQTPLDIINDDLNFILENQSDLIIKLDTKARYLFANPSFCNLIDMDLHELIGQNMFPIIYDEDLPATEKAISIIKSPPFFTELEHRIKTNSGWRWIRWTLKNIWNSKSRARTVIAAGQDITKIKELSSDLADVEETHKQSLKAQEQQYQNTLDELLELKYSYQQKIEEYEKSISVFKDNESTLVKINANTNTFMSIIAHNIKSPLQGLSNLTNFLHNELDSISQPEVKDLIETVNNSTKNLNKLLDNLLDWAKLRRDAVPYNPEPLSLKNLLILATDVFKASTKDKRISIEMDIPEELMIWADAHIINTIFRNLISNAIKFSFMGGKISVSLLSNDDIFATVVIRDFGVGIKQEVLEELRSAPGLYSNTGTMNEKGTGLGLILSYELAEINKCKLSIESLPEQGTSVFVTIPSHC